MSDEVDPLDPTLRLPPHSLPAERAVIAGLMRDPDLAHEIVPILSPDDFFREAHRFIYRAIVTLHDASRPIDPIHVENELARSGRFDAVGGTLGVLTIIREALDTVVHDFHAVECALLVRDHSRRRRLIQAASETISDGYDKSRTTPEVLEAAERRLDAITEESAVGETVRIDAIVPELDERVLARQSLGGEVCGLPSGFPDLDALTSGFHPDQLIIVAARPSMGKTAFALGVARFFVENAATPTLFASLEMGKLELAERLLVAWSGLDNRKIRGQDRLGVRDHAVIGAARAAMRAMPLFIDDTATRTVSQIHANCRRLKRREGLGAAVVDYIQLLDTEPGGRESRQEQIAKISRKLKTTAKDLRIPVIALSQLNRAVEQREDRRPRMSDLRESGAIEQDADVVILLHRPEYYDPNDQPGVAEVIVAKNRNGATGTARLAFQGHLARFVDMAPNRDEAPPIMHRRF